MLVGNSNYSDGGKLANPEQDVDAFGATLTQLGFDVSAVKNVDQDGFDDALNAFERKLTRGSVALFFYAGHGFQVDGENYLLPLRHGVESKREVKRKCISVTGVVQMLEEAPCNLRLVILDSCRNNPFKRSWSRGSSVAGFSTVRPPEGTIVAFATAPGEMANDGEGSNSPFTSSLIKAFDSAANEPVEIQRLFRLVGQECKRVANQRPFIDADSSMKDFYLGATSREGEDADRQIPIKQSQRMSTAPRKAPISPSRKSVESSGDKNSGRLGIFVFSSLNGPFVAHVVPESAATRCKQLNSSGLMHAIQVGDRIVQVNGSSVTDTAEVISAIKSSPRSLRMMVKRENRMTIELLAELDGQRVATKSIQVATRAGFATSLLKDAGIVVDGTSRHGGVNIKGVVANSIASQVQADSLPGSAASKIAVANCAAITHINHHRVRSIADADRVISNESERLRREGGTKVIFLNLVDHQGKEYICYFTQ